jgi:hypothetical protein
MVFLIEHTIALQVKLAPYWVLTQVNTYNTPRPISTESDSFVDSFMFRFQNKLAGNPARIRSTKEHTATYD